MKLKTIFVSLIIAMLALTLNILATAAQSLQANSSYWSGDYNLSSEVEREEGKSGAVAIPSLTLSQTPQLPDNATPQGWPVQGKITSPFGNRANPFTPTPGSSSAAETEFHTGVDIGVVEGTPVLATAAGVVEYAGNERGGYGEVVFITHAGGYTTIYGHNSRLLVVRGQVVNKGDIIALSGNSGHSTGPHLHYEIRYQGEPVDPTPFMDDFIIKPNSE